MKIAVLVNSLMYDGQKAFMKGVERRVRDNKDVCFSFACNVNAGDNDRYKKGEYAICELPNLSDFDGIIYARGTFQFEEGETKLDELIKASKVPCVQVDAVSKDFVNVVSREDEIMEMLVEHLVTDHGLKKLGFVGCKDRITETNLRFAGFADTLKKHELDFDKSLRFDSSCLYFDAAKTVDYFMSLEAGLPEAICCANDEIAIGMIGEFKRRGIKIPKNLKITGVDYDSISRVYAPHLTTVKRQQYQKGVGAVNALHEFDAHTKGEEIVVPVQLALGDSCGCKPELPPMDVNTTNQLATDKYASVELGQFDKSMSADTLAEIEYEKLIDVLKNYTVRMKPEELYLCLNAGEIPKFDDSDFEGSLSKFLDKEARPNFTDIITSAIELVDGNLIENKDYEKMTREQLLPSKAEGGRPGATYYFLPIHYLDRVYGYVVSGRAGDLVRSDFVTSYINNIAASCENIRKRTMIIDLLRTMDKKWGSDNK